VSTYCMDLAGCINREREEKKAIGKFEEKTGNENLPDML
jgi:hypothetical protein